MKKVEGDLIELALKGEFDVIVHGCNCFCNNGTGTAKRIQTIFPAANEVDCNTEVGDRNKLGSITFASIPIRVEGQIAAASTKKKKKKEATQSHQPVLTVVNGYTQYHYKGKGVLVDYGARYSVFRHVKKEFSGKRIGYSRIGAGSARGNWDLISAIIDEALDGGDHTAVEKVLEPIH